MSTLIIIREVCIIILGVIAIAAIWIFEAEPWMGLLGVAMIVWGIYDIAKEVRDVKKGSDVEEMAEAREEIRSKLDGDA